MSDTTIPFTEDEALKTYGGPLPTGVDPEKYEELLVTIKEDGLQELRPQERDIIKQVIEHQKSVSINPPPQPVQDAPSGVEPGKEPGEMKASHRGLQGPLRANLIIPVPMAQRMFIQSRAIIQNRHLRKPHPKRTRHNLQQRLQSHPKRTHHNQSSPGKPKVPVIGSSGPLTKRIQI